MRRPATRSRQLAIALLSLAAVLAISLAGVAASTALLQDEVSLVSVRAHGGTLALEVAAGKIAADAVSLQDLRPGDNSSRSFTVTNTGSVDADLSVQVTELAGTGPAGCFDFELLDGAGAVLATLDAIAIVELGAITPGAEGARTVQLRATNREDCAINGATGGIVAKVTAIQRDGDA